MKRHASRQSAQESHLPSLVAEKGYGEIIHGEPCFKSPLVTAVLNNLNSIRISGGCPELESYRNGTADTAVATTPGTVVTQ